LTIQEAGMTDEQMALVARALAHPARIRIVQLLAAQTECRGHEVFSELPLAQSTVSEHLRVLKEAGLVQSHPVGTAMVYCLIPSVLDEFNRAVSQLAACAAECVPGSGGC
jgi:ArsR family transcriptional regulator